jgi:uncharacterized protein
MNFSKNALIAVVGVSSDPQKYGHKIFRDLLHAGYNVVGINPKKGIVLNQEIFASLKDLPQKPELVLIVVPPPIGVHILKECSELGFTTAWMQPGAESKEAQDYAATHGISLTTATCFMVDQGIW